MLGKRIAIGTATAAMVAIGATTEMAWAGGQGDPLYGDLNRDGLTDRATLAAAPPDRCAVRVELGTSGGRYRPPSTYTYPKPGADPAGHCPDVGVIVDLGGNGSIELVLAWFDGRPPGVTSELLVLRDYTPAGGFTAIDQPSFMGLADFNGDGRQDIYEWTDQGDGFATFLNTADGRLVPGPVKWCSGRPEFHLADFNGNGAMDVAIAYAERCGDLSSGVVVVLDKGRVVRLEQDAVGAKTWMVAVLDANNDGVPDVRTDNRVTGEVTHFIGNGGGTFTAAPVANDDVAYAHGGKEKSASTSWRTTPPRRRRKSSS
jgi:hypothetical protein